MALSVFDDKLRKPEDGELADALGRTNDLWNELKHRREARGYQDGELALIQELKKMAKPFWAK